MFMISIRVLGKVFTNNMHSKIITLTKPLYIEGDQFYGQKASPQFAIRFIGYFAS